MLLGAALFALDYFIASRTEDPYTIRIDRERDQWDRESFRQQHGREPDENELRAVRREWLDREVLYREGIAMQLDKGDPLIRDRIIFKMLNLIEAGLSPPVFDEQAVRSWFEQNRARYGNPASPEEFEKVAPLVLRDWLDAQMDEQRSAAVLSMASRYKVEVSGERE